MSIATKKIIKDDSAKEHHQQQAEECMQLKLTLCWVRPAVVRVVIVKRSDTLNELHEVVCRAMGWKGRDGKHEFCNIDNGIDRIPAEVPASDDSDSDRRNYFDSLSKLRIEDVMSPSSKKMLYRYDDEDDWEHVIELQKEFRFPAHMVPCCIDGSNASPPEDVGGPDAYRKFCRKRTKTIVHHPAPDYFDPTLFDPSDF